MNQMQVLLHTVGLSPLEEQLGLRIDDRRVAGTPERVLLLPTHADLLRKLHFEIY
jgi:hypothetical protein